jgi:hypothetical protein
MSTSDRKYQMKKTTTVDFELAYKDICQVSFTDEDVKFTTYVDNTINKTVLPIEVFYQMWNNNNMMDHMEEYRKRRSNEDA